MAARIWPFVEIVLVAAIVIASIVLVRLFGRFFKRVYDRLDIDLQERNRTAGRIFGVASAIGVCIAILVLGAAGQSNGDSKPITAGMVLLVLQFLFSCRLARAWIPKKRTKGER
jgi:hypothetical protein